jgi:hypothetical protein
MSITLTGPSTFLSLFWKLWTASDVNHDHAKFLRLLRFRSWKGISRFLSGSLVTFCVSARNALFRNRYVRSQQCDCDQYTSWTVISIPVCRIRTRDCRPYYAVQSTLPMRSATNNGGLDVGWLDRDERCTCRQQGESPPPGYLSSGTFSFSTVDRECWECCCTSPATKAATQQHTNQEKGRLAERRCSAHCRPGDSR